MTELDSVDRLLELARAELSPSGADKLRMRAALAPERAARGLAAPLESTRSGRGQRASGTAGLLGVGLLAAVLLVGSGFGAGYWLGQRATQAVGRRESGAPAQSAAQPAAPLLAPLAPAPTPLPVLPAEPSEPSAEPAPQKSARAPALRAPAREHAAASTPPSAMPVDELSLLRRAERALRRADPALALALVAELDERFARTSLREEREAMAVMAHCGLDDADARPRAQRFLREHESSVYAERVRAACTPVKAGRGEPAEGSPPAGHE